MILLIAIATVGAIGIAIGTATVSTVSIWTTIMPTLASHYTEIKV